MKKSLSLALALAMLLALMPLAVFANGSDGLVYELSEDETYYIVSDYTGSATEVVIPSTYNGLPVREIGEGAFKECESITDVTIPNTVTIIGKSAFSGCRGITSIELPNSVTTICGWAFSACANLSDILIPDSVTTIGEYVFFWSSELTSISIPDSVTFIANNAFDGAYGLEFNVYDNAKYVGNDENPYHALITVSSNEITSCEINENTKLIAGGAFEWCMSLTNVTIPDSVISIGEQAFYYCESMESVTIGNSVTSIGYEAFYFCTSLESIIIPDCVEIMAEGVLRGCENLTDVYCEAESQPEGWSEDWNADCDATVHWAYEPKLSLGDIDGDEEITTADYVLTKRAFMDTYSLTDAQKIAADIDKDNEITTADYILVKRAFMGTYVIKG